MGNEKLNTKLNNGIREIREIKMTADEKKRILENILNSDLTLLEKPIQSPFWKNFFISELKKNSFTYSGLAFCLLLFLSSGLVFASGRSLPGDALYPLKVKVIEPTLGVFAFSPLSKIQYESDLATERLVEAETLSDRNRLTSTNEAKLSGLLENHTKVFNKAVDKFNKEKATKQKTNEDKDNNNKDNEVITNFQTRMNARKRVLNIINENKKPESKSDNKESKQEKKPAKYKKRKEVIESVEKLINSESSKNEAKTSFKTDLNLGDKDE